jgi:mono/diheme cytochrome c family protein
MSLASADLRENSGLKFPHDVHLAPEGIQSPNGDKVLQCASCHAPEPGGARMQPVDFETMCQECHRLDFDITEPNRQVPHGKLPEIVYMLDEFYAQRALEGGISEPSAPPSIIQRRRPGQALTRQEQIEALAWAREKARVVGERLFNGKACTVCHTVSRGDTAEEPWKVAPVRVAGAWFTKARFTHADHTIPPCEQCHRARDSKQASDLLILGVESCRACHGGAHAQERVESTCIMCHGYHEWDAQRLPSLQASAKSEDTDSS